jgi:hypothetical protein
MLSVQVLDTEFPESVQRPEVKDLAGEILETRIGGKGG